MSDADVAKLDTKGTTTARVSGSAGIGGGGLSVTVIAAWAVVGIPILWGIFKTLSKAAILLH